ncbi:hypothetical protein LEP1GSC151_3069 [Leptospira interrogans serovar Grippotyphosa str. LT2186]|uniref:Uncharacterized protein n=1 Tax=Leptospira interrogans serovar Grippotyphosa str. LT2186 TaxID=1001599 RepID=M3I5N7_LEPIR|nr:hypothetical protein LEP1GSC151_3069 [Leptospira interrogans serovar Grippotyphosa str. LT2186]
MGKIVSQAWEIEDCKNLKKQESKFTILTMKSGTKIYFKKSVPVRKLI